MSIVIVFLTALFLTIVIEFFVYCFFVDEQKKKLFVFSALINSLTLPLATYLFLFFLKNFFIVEAIVFFSEAFLIKTLLKTNYKKAFVISFIANFITSLISLIFFI